jgi:heme exporter protein D
MKKYARRQSQRLRKPRSEPVDCGNKQCFLDYVFLTNCIIYIHSNETNCDIPCKLDGCKKELHHFISCPLWTCNEISTTTISTTTTSRTTSSSTMSTTTSLATTPPTTAPTTTPPFPFPPLDHPAYLYLSIACNILFLIILMLVAIGKCKKRIVRFVHARRNRNQNRNEGTAHLSARFQNYFGMGDENEPLLPGSSQATRSTQGSEGAAPSTFGAQSTQSASADRAQFLETTFGALGGFQNQPLQVPGTSNPPSSFLNTPTSPIVPRSNLDEYLLMKTFRPKKETKDVESQTNVESETNLQFPKCNPKPSLTRSQERLCL